MNALEVANSAVQSRYGCFWLRGERKYARSREPADAAARDRSRRTEREVRWVKAREALVAEGRLRRVGRVRLLRE